MHPNSRQLKMMVGKPTLSSLHPTLHIGLLFPITLFILWSSLLRYLLLCLMPLLCMLNSPPVPLHILHWENFIYQLCLHILPLRLLYLIHSLTFAQLKEMGGEKSPSKTYIWTYKERGRRRRDHPTWLALAGLSSWIFCFISLALISDYDIGVEF